MSRLKRQVADVSAPQLRTITSIQGAITRMAGLLDDLNDYSATQIQGTLSISREHGNVRALCEEAVEEAQLAHPGRQVDLSPGENIAADVDPQRFHQLLGNLLRNALTYGAPDRPVRVSLRRSHGFCVVTVSNDGEPIPKDAMSGLFQPFRRGPHANGGGHMGLGLFIVQQIAHAHGGGVDVESSPEGTHFSVRLPCRSS